MATLTIMEAFTTRILTITCSEAALITITSIMISAIADGRAGVAGAVVVTLMRADSTGSPGVADMVMEAGATGEAGTAEAIVKVNHLTIQ
jgi:hypothetical protein